MNPNNPAYQASVDNRSNQLNPNHPEYKDLKCMSNKSIKKNNKIE